MKTGENPEVPSAREESWINASLCSNNGCHLLLHLSTEVHTTSNQSRDHQSLEDRSFFAHMGC